MYPIPPIVMKTRTMLTAAGVAAGAAVGATSMFVAMKPKLRRALRKKGLTRESLSLLGKEMKHDAEQAAHDLREFAKEETLAATAAPRRWLRNRAADVEENV